MTARRIVFALALLGWVAFGAPRWRSENPFDFHQFWVVGRAAAGAGLTDVYRTPDHRHLIAASVAHAERSGSAAERAGARLWSAVGMQPTGTPFFYAALTLFTTGDFDTDYRLFRWLSLAGYLAALVAFAFWFGHHDWATLGAVVLFTQLFWPFWTDVGFANVEQLQVAWIALLAAALRRESAARDAVAGALAGALLLFKPTVLPALALLAIFWIAERRPRRLLRCALGGIAGLSVGFLLPALRFGAVCSWSSWRTEFPRLMFTDRYLGSGLLGKLVGLRDLALFSLFALLLLAGAAALIVAAVRRGSAPAVEPGRSPASARRDEFLVLALGLGIYLLSGPIVHSHYFLLAVPLALAALAPGQPVSRSSAAAVAVALIAAHPWLKALGLTAAPNHSLWSFLGVAILVALGLEMFWRQRGTVSRLATVSSAVDPFVSRSEAVGVPFGVHTSGEKQTDPRASASGTPI